MVIGSRGASGGGGEYTITDNKGAGLPSTASPGDFVNSRYYFGVIQSVKTQSGKSVPYSEAGKHEYNCVFVMPSENVIVK